MATDAGSATAPPIAGIDGRFAAFVVDRLVAWALLGVACWAAYAAYLRHDRPWPAFAVFAGAAVVVWLAFAVAVGTSRVTPGLALAGLRCVDAATGEPIGVGRALLRSLVLGLAGLPTLGIGLATLAWTALADPRHLRRGWHDQLTGSLVVDVRPRAAEAVPADPGQRHVVNLTAMRLVPAAAISPPTEGRPQETGTVRRASVLVPDAPGGWLLEFDTGQRVPADGLVLVGRRPAGRPGESVTHAVALPSQDLSLSKTHAQLAVADDGALVVMDRGSTNGSVLVRQGVSRPLPGGRSATLLEGDIVRFGDRSMRVSRVGPGPA
jgi:uncharacterized RDD family membrane protein YckC